jgi:hypothetical protein
MGVSYWNGESVGHMRFSTFNQLRDNLYETAHRSTLDAPASDEVDMRSLAKLLAQPDDDGIIPSVDCAYLADTIERLKKQSEKLSGGDLAYYLNGMVKGLRACAKDGNSFTWS